MNAGPELTPQRLTVHYFDGRSSRAREVLAWLEGGQLRLQGADVDRTEPARQVQWPERTQHGPRIALLPEGGSLQSVDAAAWDAWQRCGGLGESAMVRSQQSWRGVLLSLAALVLLLSAAYVWGLPWLARGVADRLPDSVENRVGEVAIQQFETLLEPSKLSAQEQRAVELAWDRLVRAHAVAQQARGQPLRSSRLLIRHSRIGPNAVALPGGTMVLTDDLVRLVQHDTRVLNGVLAHELGHVQYRHGMRMLVQVGVLGAVTSLLWGDYSGILAAAPLWLGQAHYSRQAEREADAYSAQALRDAGESPAVMITLLERFGAFRRCGDAMLKPTAASTAPECPASPASPANPASGHTSDDEEGPWGIGFASHPADEERIAFFRAAR